MTDTNKATNVFSFAGKNYTSEQFDVITGIFIVEDILKYTGISLVIFLAMDSTKQSRIVDVAKRAAHKATPDVNRTMDDIQKMFLMMRQNHLSEFSDVIKHDPQGNEVIKNEKPFTSVGRMFHEFLKTNPPDELASKDNSKDAIRIMHQEYSVKEYQYLVSRFHALNIHALLGITFEEFARMPFIQQAAIMDVLSPPAPKPDAA